MSKKYLIISFKSYLIAPDTIVIGGGISEQKELIEKEIRENISNNIMSYNFLPKKIVCASLGNMAGLVGAVYNWNSKK